MDQLAQDIQKSFLGILNDYLPKDLKKRTEENQLVKILSIACGRFREAKSLFDYFLPDKDQIKLYGIEIDSKLFQLAKSDCFIAKNQNLISLKNGDATTLQNYKEWLTDGLFDVVIVRHPEITFNTQIFTKIFSICPNLVKVNGYLLITTHFESEKEMLKAIVKQHGFNILVEEINKQSPAINIDGKTRYADRFLLVAER